MLVFLCVGLRFYPHEHNTQSVRQINFYFITGYRYNTLKRLIFYRNFPVWKSLLTDSVLYILSHGGCSLQVPHYCSLLFSLPKPILGTVDDASYVSALMRTPAYFNSFPRCVHFPNISSFTCTIS